MAHIHAALAAAGRSIDDIDIACYIIFSVDEDGDRARRAAKPIVAHYLRRNPDPTRAVFAGLDRDRVTQLQRRLRSASDGNRHDEAVAGGSRRCRERARRSRNAGRMHRSIAGFRRGRHQNPGALSHPWAGPAHRRRFDRRPGAAGVGRPQARAGSTGIGEARSSGTPALRVRDRRSNRPGQQVWNAVSSAFPALARPGCSRP